MPQRGASSTPQPKSLAGGGNPGLRTAAPLRNSAHSHKARLTILNGRAALCPPTNRLTFLIQKRGLCRPRLTLDIAPTSHLRGHLRGWASRRFSNPVGLGRKELETCARP